MDEDMSAVLNSILMTVDGNELEPESLQNNNLSLAPSVTLSASRSSQLISSPTVVSNEPDSNNFTNSVDETISEAETIIEAPSPRALVLSNRRRGPNRRRLNNSDRVSSKSTVVSTERSRSPAEPSQLQNITYRPGTRDIIIPNLGDKRIFVRETDKFCYCRNPAKDFLIQCKGCKQLFHPECTALTPNDANAHEFKCSDCQPDQTYEVEAIVGMRKDGEGFKFRIKWKGYERNTWEREDDLGDCVTLLNNYLRSRGRKLSSLPIETRLGSSQPMNPKDNWQEISTVLNTVKTLVSNLSIRKPLDVSIFECLGTYTQIYIIPHLNHAYVLLYIAEESRGILADGGNLYIDDPQIQAAIKTMVNLPIKPLRFLQQHGENHCASSAALLAVELMRYYVINTEITTITVNRRHLDRTKQKFHKHPDTPLRGITDIKLWPEFICTKCNKTFKRKQSMVAHTRLCN